MDNSKASHWFLPSLTGLGLLPASQRAAVDAYVQEVEQAAAQLRIFAYKAQAMGLTGSGGIASAIESQSWTLKTFRVRLRPHSFGSLCCFPARSFPAFPSRPPSPPLRRKEGATSLY